jgi:signal transduction histidine kinase
MIVTVPSAHDQHSAGLALEAHRSVAQHDEVEAITLRFAESLDLTDVLDQVAQQVAGLFDGVCQVRFTPARRRAAARWVVAGPGMPTTTRHGVGPAETYAALLAQLSVPQQATVAPGDKQSDHATRACAELLFSPLITRGHRLGVIEVMLRARDETTAAPHMRLLRTLAAHAALAIDTADQFAQCRPPAEVVGDIPSGGSLDRLLALLAHDLRGPLATLSSSVQLLVRTLRDGAKPDHRQVARMTDMAEAAVVQLETQINTLLPGPADGPTQHAAAAPPVDLVRIARLLVNFYQQTTGEHELNVVAAVPELHGPWPQPHLERVLGTLLANGIKYSPTGSTISVAVGREEDTLGSWAILSVQNPGIDIHASELAYPAQPGSRAWHSGAIPVMGYGLANVREVVEQHGGTLAIQSEVGGATTVYIRLPLT